jgi:hypothetical protein
VASKVIDSRRAALDGPPSGASDDDPEDSDSRSLMMATLLLTEEPHPSPQPTPDIRRPISDARYPTPDIQ